MTPHEPSSIGPSAGGGLPPRELSMQEKEQLTVLLNALADGDLGAAEERQLRNILDRGEPARRLFREFAELHAGLHWDYAMLLAPGVPPRSVPEKGGGWWRPTHRAAAMLAAIVAAAATSVTAWLLIAGPAGSRPQWAGDGPIATVTQTRYLLPCDGQPPLTVGQFLGAGRIAIGGGAVQFTLRNGVVIVFEGPGELDLAGELSATLHDGNVVVRMPEGMKGFVVRTPTTEVLDLGTEFAVSIGPGKTTDVQVYEGAVIASAGRRQEGSRLPKRVVAGEAARFLFEPKADMVAMSFRPERFVRELAHDIGIPYASASSPQDDSRHFGPARQHSIAVHAAPAGMVIDGRLDEWAGGPGFHGSLDGSAACKEWADGRMMYDHDCLYIAAHVGDPMPLRSIIDPEVDGSWGWRGGAVQVRVSTDRRMGWPAVGNGPSYYGQRHMEPTAEQEKFAKNPRIAHLTMWFHAPTKTPCLTINHGMLFTNTETNPAGFVGAFVADRDGRGYTMEYAIPWSLLGCADDPPQRGDVLAAVWQVLWGDEAGRMRREQMVEVRNPDEPLRINVWERAATWGRAEYR